MIRAAIVGLGGWGQNLVASVQGKSDAIRFTAGATRTPEKSRAFADAHGFPLHDRYEKVLADPAIDAVVLATPHRLHAGQIIAADVPPEMIGEHTLEGLAVRLVPIFLASRQISRTFRAWPVRE